MAIYMYVPLVIYGLRLFIVFFISRITLFTELFTCLNDQS